MVSKLFSVPLPLSLNFPPDCPLIHELHGTWATSSDLGFLFVQHNSLSHVHPKLQGYQ